tara:strand:- start:391 stop:753 length:363 start_codon:yes stop_codon:yes gene_type:complete
MKKLFFLTIIFLLNSCSENPALVIGDSYCKVVNAPRSAQYDIKKEVEPLILEALNQMFQDEVGKSYCDVVATRDREASIKVLTVDGKFNYDMFFGETPDCKIDEEDFNDLVGDVEKLCKT